MGIAVVVVVVRVGASGGGGGGGRSGGSAGSGGGDVDGGTIVEGLPFLMAFCEYVGVGSGECESSSGCDEKTVAVASVAGVTGTVAGAGVGGPALLRTSASALAMVSAPACVSASNSLLISTWV